MSLVQQSLVQEIDYGTPRSKSEKMVSLSIDGKQISIPEGTSMVRAAMETGIEIPKLMRHRHARCVRLLPIVLG